MMVRRPTTFGELISLRRTMDRVFADPFFRPGPAMRTGRRMPLDVIDTPDALILEAALPGIKPEDVDISVLGDVLTLTAGSDQDLSSVEGDYQVREVRRGRVSRSVTLPSGLRSDEASATFENGLLRLSIPRELPAERRSIPVSAIATRTVTGSAGVGQPSEQPAPAADPAPAPDPAAADSTAA
jgi:HSP20 family protein